MSSNRSVLDRSVSSQMGRRVVSSSVVCRGCRSLRAVVVLPSALLFSRNCTSSSFILSSCVRARILSRRVSLSKIPSSGTSCPHR